MKRPHLVLVDDNVDVLEIYSELLIMKGYAVTLFSQPSQALEYLTQHATEVNLVISDVKMPGIDGIEFKNRAHLIDPGLRFVLLSGHLELEHGEFDGDTPVVAKPVGIATLLAIIELHRRP